MTYEELVKALKKRRGQARGILGRGEGGFGFIRNDTRLWWEKELDVCDSALALLESYREALRRPAPVEVKCPGHEMGS
jgi:hypothetical protein